MENTAYPRIKQAVLLCLLLIVFLSTVGLLLGIIQSVFKLSDTSVWAGILNIFFNLISFGIVLLIGFRKTERNFNDVFKLNGVSPVLWIAAVIFSIGLVIVSSELDNWFGFILPMPEFLRNIFDNMAGNQVFIVSVICVGIMPAVTEELFFRGLILDGFTRNYTKRKAILISALLFGLIHLNPWQFLTAFIVGLIAAWICIETNSILLCMFIHFFNNTLFTITTNFENFVPIRGFNASSSSSCEFQPLWFTLSGLAVMAIGTLMLKKGINKLKIESESIILY